VEIRIGGELRQQFERIYQIVRGIPVKHMRGLVQCYFRHMVPALQIKDKAPNKIVVFYGV